eukprot:2445169-Rhodomonas_salina.1
MQRTKQCGSVSENAGATSAGVSEEARGMSNHKRPWISTLTRARLTLHPSLSGATLMGTAGAMETAGEMNIAGAMRITGAMSTAGERNQPCLSLQRGYSGSPSVLDSAKPQASMVPHPKCGLT